MLLWLLSARETVETDTFSALARSVIEARMRANGEAEKGGTGQQNAAVNLRNITLYGHALCFSTGLSTYPGIGKLIPGGPSFNFTLLPLA